VCWRGRSVQVRIVGSTVRLIMSAGGPADVRIGGETCVLQAGTPLEVRLGSAPAAST
jgi:hypothetical protein